jgi:hypothetical protein
MLTQQNFLSSEKVQSFTWVAINSGIHAYPAELSLSSEKVQSFSWVAINSAINADPADLSQF